MIITNIRKGEFDPKRPYTRGRDKIIYAELRSDEGKLLVAATLRHIVELLEGGFELYDKS